jgi:hypothetical protein
VRVARRDRGAGLAAFGGGAGLASFGGGAGLAAFGGGAGLASFGGGAGLAAFGGGPIRTYAAAAHSSNPAATSRQAVTDRPASEPASAAPTASPPIFRLAAVVKIWPRMCSGDSRCRTANSAVS